MVYILLFTCIIWFESHNNPGAHGYPHFTDEETEVIELHVVTKLER